MVRIIKKSMRAPAGGLKATDARSKLISKNRAGMSDAREKLVKMAHTGGDARKKLEKIRNFKAGKLDVKKTARGAITITKTTTGKTLLTTKKKEAAATAAAKNKNIIRQVGRGGAIILKTNHKAKQQKQGPPGQVVNRGPGQVINRGPGQVANRGPGQVANRNGNNKLPQANRANTKPLMRTIKGELSAKAVLDQELLNTHVDPVILKRTVRQSMRERPVEPMRYVPTSTMPSYGGVFERRRSPSPMRMEYEARSYGYPREAPPPMMTRRFNDFDDPRRAQEAEYMRGQMGNQGGNFNFQPRTMGDHLESSGGYYTGVSPLQGAKIIVSNLQLTVSQEDIIELFGDIGPLKRAKIVDRGTAEVVFVNKADALKAVEIYHNRQLDGKAMRCQMVGANFAQQPQASSFRLPSGNVPPERSLHPEMGAVHKALFNEKRSGMSGYRPMFTAAAPPRRGGRR